MLAPRTLAGPACAAILLLTSLSGCGEETHLPQTPSPTAFTTATVAINQMGNAPVTIDRRAVGFTLDASRQLVVTLTLASSAAATITVGVRATIYDSGHGIIGDATAAPVSLLPGHPTAIRLGGPTPLGTIASATFEVSVTH